MEMALPPQKWNSRPVKHWGVYERREIDHLREGGSGECQNLKTYSSEVSKTSRVISFVYKSTPKKTILNPTLFKFAQIWFMG